MKGARRKEVGSWNCELGGVRLFAKCSQQTARLSTRGGPALRTERSVSHRQRRPHDLGLSRPQRHLTPQRAAEAKINVARVPAHAMYPRIFDRIIGHTRSCAIMISKCFELRSSA